jgi:hypothetical protein
VEHVCSSESAPAHGNRLRRENILSFLQVLVFPCVGIERAGSLHDRILSCWMIEIGRACLELGLAWHVPAQDDMTCCGDLDESGGAYVK